MGDKIKFQALLAALLSVIVVINEAVDMSNFKKCADSSFCRRNRRIEPGNSPYTVDLTSLRLEDGVIRFNILNTKTGILLGFELYALENKMARMKINEVSPLKPRYEVPDILIQDPPRASWQLGAQDATSFQATSDNGLSFVLMAEPFRLDMLHENQLIFRVNSKGLMNFEHLRQKRQAAPLKKEEEEKREGEEGAEGEQEAGEEEEEEVPTEEDEDGMWEETFKTHRDSKPNGPSSIGMDFSFPGFEYVYGIPEHADTLVLRNTKNGDPYRLYNLDVFEYELSSTMALYGSVPVMLAHNTDRTVGMFWLNAAETWVDISSNMADKSMFGRMWDFVKGDQEVPEVNTHWFSESGIIDTFFLFGPTPQEFYAQYASLTGYPYMPPMFSIGYHQCRWNYNDEEDVKNVDAKFDEHDIPYDVIWLDIEHTNGKRHMTWDKHKFPRPAEMQNHIASKGRKMVTIVDPHLKRDNSFHLYQQGKDNDIFVKNKDGNEYDGWCWPGSSSYPDFTRSDVREWWASKFDLSIYEGSTLNLFTWNDMNEPSVFNGPEVTMPKDNIHAGGWEHRDVHNIYGIYVHSATVDGQLKRTGGKERPFVLSRSFFAGTQRYGAIWTGDNSADWGHLKASMPMLLSLGLAGITFAGADVGGFFKNPDEELLARWYQAGAYQPFFRGHAHLDTKRREPWLFSDATKAQIRRAIRSRYALLPYWYTMFYQATKNGIPIMRPLWVEFPSDPATFTIEDEYMLGSALLVRPITDAGASSVQIYLPGQNTRWYRKDTFAKFNGPSTISLSVVMTSIPVFQRGGTIIPSKERVRRASSLSVDDPYTLRIALDALGSAEGQLYLDDGHSNEFQSQQYLYRQLTFSDNVLSCSSLDPKGQFKTSSWVERILILGLSQVPSSVTLNIQGQAKGLEFNLNEFNVLTVRKPGVNIAEDWSITLS